LKPCILVTGGNGFLGSAILRGLERFGFHAICGGRTKPAGFSGGFLCFDLTDFNSVNTSFGSSTFFDIVIHSAGSLGTRCEEINHLGTRNLLRALDGKMTRWIQISSAGVYQNSYRGVIDETTICDPKTDYEKSKFRADEEVLRSSINSILLRPSMVAGNGMKGKPLRILARLLHWGLRPDFTDKHVLNLVHVNDVVEAILHFCEFRAEIPNKSAFLLSDDLNYPEVMRILGERGKRKGLTLSARLIGILARAGSVAGVTGFNSGTVARMFNEAKISSDLFRSLRPDWPKTGSIRAVQEFARSQKGNPSRH